MNVCSLKIITMNVNPGGENGSGTVETLLFGMKKLTSSLRKLLRISVFVMRFMKTKVWNRIGGRHFNDSLLITVFQNLSDKGSITAMEIQLVDTFYSTTMFCVSVYCAEGQQETRLDKSVGEG